MFSRYAVAFVLIVAFCALAGCGGKGDPAATGPKVTFDQHCASCHAQAGQPGGPSRGGSKGPSLEKIGKEHDADWLADYIRDPRSKRADASKMMPAFGGKLTDPQIKELAEWLAAKK
jgi:mono/diheme cytochrome c family protein